MMGENQFNKLTNNLIREIMKMTDVDDVCILERTCKRFNQVSNSNVTWTFFLKKDFDVIRHAIMDDGVTSKEIYKNETKYKYTEYSLLDCTIRDVNYMKNLLRRNVDINEEDRDGCTALVQACYNSSEKVILLVKMGADIEKADQEGLTPLMCACKRGSLLSVDVLLQHGADVDAMSIYDQTALMLVWGRVNFEIVNLLLTYGASMNLRDNIGKTALIYAITRSDSKLAELLISMGCDTDKRDWKGHTALMWAIKYRNMSCIKQLLTNVNTCNKKGKTALIYAVQGDHMDITSLLIDAGAELDVIDNRGLTALMYACKNRARNEIISTLINHGADIHIVAPKFGWKAIDFAAYLLDMIPYTFNAMFLATIGEGHIGVANLLLKHGADINIRNEDGWTALMYASFTNNRKVMNFLINEGADVNVVDKDNWDALKIAEIHGCTEAIELLSNNSGIKIYQK